MKWTFGMIRRVLKRTQVHDNEMDIHSCLTLKCHPLNECARSGADQGEDQPKKQVQKPQGRLEVYDVIEIDPSLFLDQVRPLT